MRLTLLPFVVFVLAISCVSYQNPTQDVAAVIVPAAPAVISPEAAIQEEEEEVEMERERQPAAAADPAQPLTFEQVLSQSADGLRPGDATNKLLDDGKQFLIDRRKFGQTGAFIKKCAADLDHPFCQAYRFYKSNSAERNRGPRKPKVSAKVVKKYFKEKDFENLKTVGLSSLVAVAKKMKPEELRDISKAVVENQQCLSEDLYVGLGSTLEFDFPNEENVNLNNQLLEKTQKCFTSEMSARSTFRRGMFKVWKNQCDEAIPLFDLSLNNQNLRNLHSRSTYWRDWCRSKKGEDETAAAPVPAQFYKNFPESFHALLADDGPTPVAYNLLTTNVDPQIKFRSMTNKEFNGYLDTVDTFIKLGEQQLAFGLLENLKAEQFQNEDPEVLMYLAIVCNRVQAGLIKFQILGKVFDKNPSFKTVKTMKLYYPSWYMDTVVQYKEKINPYLIMALIRQESAFNARAHSPAGARGLMQLLPGTAKSFGRVKKNDLFTPEKNIASGIKFFSHLMERYNNQVPLALAAYNAGPMNVDDWVKRYPTENPLLFIDIIPFRETREYVSSILRNWYWYNKLYAEPYPTQSNRNTDPIAHIFSSNSNP